ncbi:sensor domain-containing diguanylate cyclase [Photobacterium makurazakiensis]|uniref:sensor domain-containing diguanylate cyclase n=1 Tax=Photobacterium makurazakiensis TaxID=2910234 RepID=UPI003D0FD2E7
MERFPEVHIDYDNAFDSDFGTLIHREFKPVYADESLCRILGFDSTFDILSLPSLLDLFNNVSPESAFKQYHNVISGKLKPRVRTFFFSKADNRRMNLLTTESVVEWEGNPAIQIFVIDITEKYEKYNQLQQHANIDSLSKLANRYRLGEILETEVKKAQLQNYPVTCLFIDIDNFKAINDQYGHAAGDEAIRRLSHCFKSSLRKSDFIGRWGGDEFLVILPKTPQEIGENLAERLRCRVSKLTIPHALGTFSFTISLGSHTLIHNPYNALTLVKQADIALHHAKSHGRNKVITYSSLFEDAV